MRHLLLSMSISSTQVRCHACHHRHQTAGCLNAMTSLNWPHEPSEGVRLLVSHQITDDYWKHHQLHVRTQGVEHLIVCLAEAVLGFFSLNCFVWHCCGFIYSLDRMGWFAEVEAGCLDIKNIQTMQHSSCAILAFSVQSDFHPQTRVMQLR